jgi:hypothetical protein
MARKFWILGAACIALFFARCTSAGPDKQSGAIRLKVSVFNDAQVPGFVLREAERRAQAVFDQAGVSLTWLDCGTPGHWNTELGCRDVAYPTHLSVRLVAGRQVASGDIFGQSFLNESGEGNYANVYLTPLSSAKALGLVREGDLLGCVVVHELGHLLLGKNSHSGGGLMRAKWEVTELREAAKGNLLFTKGETDRMRVRYWSAVARAEGGSSAYNVSGR